MNTTFRQVGPLTREGFDTTCTTCESNTAAIRVTTACFECRDRARMDRDHNRLVLLLLLIAALGVAFEIGFNLGGRG